MSSACRSPKPWRCSPATAFPSTPASAPAWRPAMRRMREAGMQRLLISCWPGECRAALLDAAGRLNRLLVHRDHHPASGAVHLARTRATAPDASGAFLDLGGGITGFLKRRARSRLPAEGAMERVQIQSFDPAEPGKAVRVARHILLEGRYLDLDPERRGVMFERIDDEGMPPLSSQRRQGLEAALSSIGERIGVRLKRAAAAVDEDVAAAEAARLDGHWRMVEAAMRSSSRQARRILAGPDGLMRAVLMLEGATPDEIRIEHPAVMAGAIRSFFARYPDLADRLAAHRESTPLFEAFGVEDRIATLIDGDWPIEGGGALHLERARLGWVIDVDAVARTARGDRQGLLAGLSTRAAQTAADLVRMLDLGGLIVIDFPTLSEPKARRKLAEHLAQALADDPLRPDCAGLNRHGIASIARTRRGVATASLLGLPGVPSFLHEEAHLFEDLRRLAGKARHVRTGEPLELAVGPSARRRLTDGGLLDRWAEALGVGIRLVGSRDGGIQGEAS
ncbi:MAG: hypothetical protein D6757_09570 [Alphaproteobacteria bacterium]|nr:MAG: hypothetical protein D6757_09570 [Alphaproteobacteria bacterium]